MEKNLENNVPNHINMDVMTNDEIHEKLQQELKQANERNIVSAVEVF